MPSYELIKSCCHIKITYVTNGYLVKIVAVMIFFFCWLVWKTNTHAHRKLILYLQYILMFFLRIVIITYFLGFRQFYFYVEK